MKTKRKSRVCLPLFGKPAWELEDLESEEIKGELADKLEKLGEEIDERLKYAAKVLRALLARGWTAYGGLYDINLVKDVPKERAEKELRELGFTDLEVEEEEYEEEEFEEN